MTSVVLVRHASTSWSGRRYCGRADPPLSPEGRREAEKLAARLAPGLPPGIRLVSSPSRRARQTAAAIASRLPEIEIEIDDRWLEADVGLAEGRTFDELAVLDPGLAAALAAGDAAIDWPGGETATALQTRITDAWSALLAVGRPAVIVSHAGPIRIAAGLASGRAAAEVDFVAPASAITFDVRSPTPDAADAALGRGRVSAR